jgi:hypothetical protein
MTDHKQVIPSPNDILFIIIIIVLTHSLTFISYYFLFLSIIDQRRNVDFVIYFHI